MPISAPEASVKYTDEQTKQIESFKSELLNLNTDITIHANSLRLLRAQIVNITKEKNSLDERKSLLEKQIIDLESKKEQLKNDVQESSKALQTDRTETENLRKLRSFTQAEINVQESDLKGKRAKFEADRAELDNQLTQVAQEKALIQKKLSIISEVTKVLNGD